MTDSTAADVIEESDVGTEFSDEPLRGGPSQPLSVVNVRVPQPSSLEGCESKSFVRGAQEEGRGPLSKCGVNGVDDHCWVAAGTTQGHGRSHKEREGHHGAWKHDDHLLSQTQEKSILPCSMFGPP